MHKKYDERLLKSYRSYKVNDISRIFRDKKLHPQTIRGWVEQGKLKAIIDGKTILIYGAVLKNFILENNQSRKRKLAFEEFKCWKCKKISTPLDNKLSKLELTKNNYLLAHCTCPCGHEINKPFTKDFYEKIFEAFAIEQNEVGRLCDSLNTPNNTNIDNSYKTPESEPEIKPPEILIAPPNNTNIKQEQLNFLNLL